MIDLRYQASSDSPYNTGTHWSLPGSPTLLEGMATAFGDADSYPVMDRAVGYSLGYFSPKHLGAGQFYLLAIKDGGGRPLNGKRSYRLTVPPKAPVNQYWSATAYDRETHALIKQTPRSSRGSNSPDVQKNADGSVDVYFATEAPAGKESNWVPTGGRDFEVLFRFYGPEKALFDKTWKLPDIEETR